MLPSPQRAEYRRQNMKHSAEFGSCFLSVNKSIRCTVPRIKHIFHCYGPIFWSRAAGVLMKWSSFSRKKKPSKETRSNNNHKYFHCTTVTQEYAAYHLIHWVNKNLKNYLVFCFKYFFPLVRRASCGSQTSARGEVKL